MTLETERLILRPITIDDADEVFKYSSEANVGRRAGWKPHESREETIEVMKLVFIDKAGVFALVYKETGKIIGSIGLICDPKRENNAARMLGYAISEHFWGKGLMTEAAKEIIRYGFDDLKLKLISAYCYPHNLGSKRVLEKCGFTYEGRLRLCEQLYDGSVYDNECYSLLK